ncbi:hypothetical protein HZA73_11390 [candidate division TA06 bacterium]|nr:hypothetical protein [candidate division TA06 bacterium]
MRNLFIFCLVLLLAAAGPKAQVIRDYSYKLDNGATVRTEKGWNYVQAAQTFASQQKPAATGKIDVAVTAVGDLISGYGVKILKAGAEVDSASLTPGIYDLKITCPLSSSTPGDISFLVAGAVIRPKTDTKVSVTLHDVQITINEKTEPNQGLAYYETKTNRYHGNWEQNGNWSIPKFFRSGDHKVKVAPDAPGGDYYGKIRGGKYDLYLDIYTRAGGHMIWLENLELKPDVSCRITTNLNAAEVAYTGGEFEVKMLHFYPAGTAAKAKGKPRPDKKAERFAIEGPDHVTPCPPGTYDVLLNYSYGGKYVWRKGVVLEVDKKTEIK